MKIWSISESPINKGFFSTISAKMQPKDQMSTPKEYYFYPIKISGALYQRVSTSWVKVFIGTPKARAKPKSANFMFPFCQSKCFRASDLYGWFFGSGRSEVRSRFDKGKAEEIKKSIFKGLIRSKNDRLDSYAGIIKKSVRETK